MIRAILLAATVVLAGIAHPGQAQDGDFREAAARINATIRAHHYHQDELDSDRYRAIEQEVLALASKAASPDEFMNGFNTLWRKGPFSHVSLRMAKEPAAARLAKLDDFKAGPDAVKLEYLGNTALLTVNTMTGADTIAAIERAYLEITRAEADTLIIDLRRNEGGAFAVVPLVGHVIDKPIDAGVFVTGGWYADHRAPPGVADFINATPWLGYSVTAFQADILKRPLTSYRIRPIYPTFKGPVFVLTSRRSISAAEIAADALQASGRARIIGEQTPGAVLSSKLFDIPGGFHLRVPIADYFSINGKRLEGFGVTPDMAVEADKALEAALKLAADQRPH